MEQTPLPIDQPQTQPELSPEDRLAKAAGLSVGEERPRDERGRYLPADKPQEVASEKPAEAKEPETQKANPEEATDQEEIQWDAIKGLKVKVPMKNGDKEWVDEITFEDLRNQRMMHSDYMAKRREFEEQAKTYESKTREAVEKERNQYLGSLNVLHQSVMRAADAELASVDWQKLANEDPAKFVQLRARAEMFGTTLQQIAAEHYKVQKQQDEERNKRLAQEADESRKKLKDAIPTWSDDLYKSLLKRGIDSYDFKPDEVGQWTDHRLIRMLNDAHQWQLHKEQKPASEKKVVNIPPVLKSGPKAVKSDPQIRQFTEARDRLRKDGRNIDAAADVMRAFIK